MTVPVPVIDPTWAERERRLDEALAATFPASDPVALGSLAFADLPTPKEQGAYVPDKPA